MGIIKAVKQAIGGGFADTWQEVIELYGLVLNDGKNRYR